MTGYRAHNSLCKQGLFDALCFIEIENTKFKTKWDARQTLETIYSNIYIDLL